MPFKTDSGSEPRMWAKFTDLCKHNLKFQAQKKIYIILAYFTQK